MYIDEMYKGFKIKMTWGCYLKVSILYPGWKMLKIIEHTGFNFHQIFLRCKGWKAYEKDVQQM